MILLLNGAQLKTIQEVITLSVFSVFSIPAIQVRRSARQTITSCLREKWSSGLQVGNATPAASTMELPVNSASATCSRHGKW
jgi:hypothetical protein